MAVLWRYLPLTFLAILVCSRPREPGPESAGPASSPVAIVVEKVISGAILGQPLLRPAGLTVDRRSALFLCDAGNNRIVRFRPDLTPDVEIGGFGAAEGQFNRPSFITLDNDLNVLLSDEGNRRICRFNSRLQFVESIRFYDDSDVLKFGYPSGLDVTSYGEMWVADRDKNRIAVFNNVGTFDRFLGEFGYAGGQLLSPENITRTRENNFVVCDAGNGRVVIYDQYGNFRREIADDALDYPVSAFEDRSGLWVLDGSTGRIHLYGRKGSKILEAGPLLIGNELPLKDPTDFVALPGARMAVSDSGNNRVLICQVLFEPP